MKEKRCPQALRRTKKSDLSTPDEPENILSSSLFNVFWTWEEKNRFDYLRISNPLLIFARKNKRLHGSNI